MFNIPKLHCPFPSGGPHPEVDQLVSHTVGWARAKGLLPNETESTLAKVRSYSELAAACYPSAPIARLAPICDYYSWLFFFDDVCEDHSIHGGQPAETCALLTGVYNVLEGQGELGGPYEAFALALRDIWERIECTAIPAWRTRFRNHVANYIDGCVWESQHRKLRRVPSLAVFQAMRMFTSTVYEFWDLIEYAGDFCLPPAVVEHPALIELQRVANAVASYANDVYSMSKESENGDFCNLVRALEQEELISRKTAYARAAEIHDQHVRYYCRLERLLPHHGLVLTPELNRYLGSMRIWLRANQDWSMKAPRYHQAAAVEHTQLSVV